MGKMICRCRDIQASVESCLHLAAPDLLSILTEREQWAYSALKQLLEVSGRTAIRHTATLDLILRTELYQPDHRAMINCKTSAQVSLVLPGRC